MTTLALGPSWLDPDYLIGTFGLIGVLVIVFAESGLLIGFFLPGDSLLFTTGLLVTAGTLKSPLWLVCLLVVLAAIAGDQVGYLFGRKVGPALFRRPDSKLFKQENVEKAHEFFEKHGPKSLVLARFVPVIRTFTPIIAGVSRMNYRSFITFNIIGGLLWGAGVTLLGAALGKIEFVHQHIEMILILIVLISVLPIVIEFLRARAKSKKAAALEPGVDDGQVGPGTAATDAYPAAYGAAAVAGAPAPGTPGADTMRFPKVPAAPSGPSAPSGPQGGGQAGGQQTPNPYQTPGPYQAPADGQAPGPYRTPGGQQAPNPYQTPGGYPEQQQGGYGAPGGYQDQRQGGQGGHQGSGGYQNPNPYQQTPSPYQGHPNPYQGNPDAYQGTPNPYQETGGYQEPNGYQGPGGYQAPDPYQAPRAPHTHQGPAAPDDSPDGPGDPHGRHARY
ncbi:VTT domain-containing protein [Streptomyces sp. NPDC012623]|uniref:VTT domain-containing protein n=1 Tax=unclassified Streptomyces TaxID=2593676 RepID=UPI0036941024